MSAAQIGPLGLGLAQVLDGAHDRIELGELLGQLDVGRLVDALVQLGLDGSQRCSSLSSFSAGMAVMGEEKPEGETRIVKRITRRRGGHGARQRPLTRARSAACRPCAPADR